MPRRIPLLLKKRGRRRSGSPALARVGHALYHAMFVVGGLIGMWWSLTDVLLPEWRLADQSMGFERTECLVRGERVATRPGLAEDEYCPELEVEFTIDGGETIRAWTRFGVGRDTPSHDEAQAALSRYEVGEERPCWYDPADPRRVLLSVRHRWWPWLVLSIPISLVVLGGMGLASTLVSSQSSAERRSALLARGANLPRLDTAALRPTAACGLPPLEADDVSPGTERSHRLAADGAEGWRVAGMATLCLVWNVLVALFAYQIGVGYLSSGIRIGVAALLAGPLAIIGWRMTLSTWRDARGGSGGTTRVEIDEHPLVLGHSAEATLVLSGPLRLRSLEVALVCEESATFRQGTDTRTASVEVFRRSLLSKRRVEVGSVEPLRFDFEVVAPAEGPHSFLSPNNEVRWSLEVMISTPGREDDRRRFPLCFYPVNCEPDPASPSRRRTAGGVA